MVDGVRFESVAILRRDLKHAGRRDGASAASLSRRETMCFLASAAPTVLPSSRPSCVAGGNHDRPEIEAANGTGADAPGARGGGLRRGSGVSCRPAENSTGCPHPCRKPARRLWLTRDASHPPWRRCRPRPLVKRCAHCSVVVIGHVVSADGGLPPWAWRVC